MNVDWIFDIMELFLIFFLMWKHFAEEPNEIQKKHRVGLKISEEHYDLAFGLQWVIKAILEKSA